MVVPIDSSQVRMLINDYLPQELVRAGGNGMLNNGGRIYPDPLSFLEITTAEDDSIMGTVSGEIATERIVSAIVHAAIQERKLPESTRINKRVVSDIDLKEIKDSDQDTITTWGYHASFSTESDKLKVERARLDPLALHLATMNIFAGAGILRDFGGETKYAIAQKVLNLNSGFSAASYGKDQPLISLRDENHSDERFGRVHVTALDAHISPWASWMSLGTTSIIIKLMESGYLGRDLIGRDQPYRIAKAVAHDPNLKNTYKMAGGKELHAVEIQRFLYEKATGLELTAEEQAIMGEWKRALDVLEDGPMQLTEADWVMRLKLIEKKLAKAGLELTSNVAKYWNDRYDLIYEYPKKATDEQTQPQPDIVGLLRSRSVFAAYMPTEEQIQSRIYSPPDTTRAAVRSRIIDEHSGKPDFYANWAVAGYKEGGIKYTFDLSDPFNSTDENMSSEPIKIK